MIGLFCIFLAVGSAVAYTHLPYAGVDPNTLSCDPKGQIFLLLPHYTDCTLYYQCVHGREVLMPGCPSPLIFDFEAQVCNWDWAAKCILRDQNDDIEGSGEEDDIGSGEEDDIGSGMDFNEEKEFGWMHLEEAKDELDTKLSRVARDVNNQVNNNGKVAELFAPAVLDCSLPESAARHLAYRGDCQRFWRCVLGVPQTFFCTDGLFFNEASQTCDFEANVRCLQTAEEELGSEFIVYK